MEVGPYLKARGGLPHVAAALKKRALTIGYLGGSVTMMKKGWRPLLQQWFDSQFPKFGPHRQLNASRGGVGSASGAFFVQEEICGKSPDLLFVEFAINDSFVALTPKELRLEMIEGIVRAVKKRHAECDICFVYTTHVLQRREIAGVVRTYERVAEHYGIASIHAGRFMADLVASGKWIWMTERLVKGRWKPVERRGREVLLRDACHPTGVGNEALTELIGQSVRRLIRGAGRPRGLPAALSRWSVEAGRIEPVTREMVEGRCRRVREIVGNYDKPVTYYSLPLGSRLKIQSRGAVVGLYVVLGQRSGVIDCRTGRERVRRNLFDQWCSYRRIGTVILIERREDMARKGVKTVVSLSKLLPNYKVCHKLKKPPRMRTLDVASVFTV